MPHRPWHGHHMAQCRQKATGKGETRSHDNEQCCSPMHSRVAHLAKLLERPGAAKLGGELPIAQPVQGIEPLLRRRLLLLALLQASRLQEPIALVGRRRRRRRRGLRGKQLLLQQELAHVGLHVRRQACETTGGQHLLPQLRLHQLLLLRLLGRCLLLCRLLLRRLLCSRHLLLLQRQPCAVQAIMGQAPIAVERTVVQAPICQTCMHAVQGCVFPSSPVLKHLQ